VFFYSRSIFENANIHDFYIPFAVMGVNAVNVAMTIIAVRSPQLTHTKAYLWSTISFAHTVALNA